MHAFDFNDLQRRGFFGTIDLAFSNLIRRLDPGCDDWVVLAAALVSRATGQGHVCLDLEAMAEELGSEETPLAGKTLDAAAWRDRLDVSGMVGRPLDFRPLILEDSRLYLHRYWRYEHDLAKAILQRCGDHAGATHVSEKRILRYFDGSDPDQLKAAMVAAGRRFCVISGGPGTGKTHTLAKLIVMRHSMQTDVAPRILLAAPTGKAAARLQESLEGAMRALRENGLELGELPEPCTLHRLLGYQPARSRFIHSAENPLAADMVVVDEASMVDLALMNRLFHAVPGDATLILTGDKDQLASVEAGAVLGDICYGAGDSDMRAPSGKKQDAGQSENGGLASHIVVLKRNYRFGEAGGIGALSRAINAGDAAAVLDLLENDDSGAIGLRTVQAYDTMTAFLDGQVLEAYVPALSIADPLLCLEKINSFRVLTALRKGPYGAEGVNRRIEKGLFAKGLILPPASAASPWWYAGKPVMITRNDYFHGLFNGDIGVAVEDEPNKDGRIRIAFPDNRGGIKRLTPHQLPAHETVYAMTVHKSQGSEFETVVLVLPDQDVPLLTRELLYTAVTRARKRVVVCGQPEILARAVRRRVQRYSGLRKALWDRP